MTQLQASIEPNSSGTVKGSASASVILAFDSNLFGEALTAPHVRLPTLQPPVVSKIWKAIHQARADPQMGGLFPIGDVAVIIDGGRRSDVCLNYFGLGKDRKTSDKGRTLAEGKTLHRQIIVCLTESSVKQRKHRVKKKIVFCSARKWHIVCSMVRRTFHTASIRHSRTRPIRAMCFLPSR